MEIPGPQVRDNSRRRPSFPRRESEDAGPNDPRPPWEIAQTDRGEGGRARCSPSSIPPHVRHYLFKEWRGYLYSTGAPRPLGPGKGQKIRSDRRDGWPPYTLCARREHRKGSTSCPANLTCYLLTIASNRRPLAPSPLPTLLLRPSQTYARPSI